MSGGPSGRIEVAVLALGDHRDLRRQATHRPRAPPSAAPVAARRRPPPAPRPSGRGPPPPDADRGRPRAAPCATCTRQPGVEGGVGLRAPARRAVGRTGSCRACPAPVTAPVRNDGVLVTPRRDRGIDGQEGEAGGIRRADVALELRPDRLLVDEALPVGSEELRCRRSARTRASLSPGRPVTSSAGWPPSGPGTCAAPDRTATGPPGAAPRRARVQPPRAARRARRGPHAGGAPVSNRPIPHGPAPSAPPAPAADQQDRYVVRQRAAMATLRLCEQRRSQLRAAASPRR